MTALLDTIRFLLVDLWPITAVVVLGCAAVYLLLPRPQAPRLWIGLGIGLCALVAAGLFLLPPGEAPTAALPEVVLFYLFSAIAVVSGVLLVTQRNPARAALSFALVVLSTCGLFLLQAAPFLAAATAIVYAGAIVVTFLFVLMLAQQEGPSDADFRSREPFLASVAGFVLLGTLLYVLRIGCGTGELDEMVSRARTLQGRVESYRAEAGDPQQVEEAITRAHLLLRLPDPEVPESRPGEVEQLHTDLANWAQQSLRGADPDNPLVAAISGLDSASTPVRELRHRAANVKPPEAQKALGGLKEALAAVVDAGGKARSTLGSLRPDQALPVSKLSGPAANTIPEQLRRDSLGRPQMPAENVAYLGRSLFTDYLLAVELAGTLLLVAAVGAIAIAHARQRPAPENRP